MGVTLQVHLRVRVAAYIFADLMLVYFYTSVEMKVHSRVEMKVHSRLSRTEPERTRRA
jgi:hypothetical protein